MNPSDRVPDATLEQGAVYYMRQRKFVRNTEEHFHVVLNKAPLKDQKIYVAIITSKVEKRRASCPEGTLVEFDKKDYRELRVHSAIDCNRLIETSRELFMMDIRYKSTAKRCEPFPLPLLEKVIAGVEKSKTVEPYIKKLIC